MPEREELNQPEVEARTANEELSEQMVGELISSGLLLESRRAIALQKMLLGKVLQSDWRLWAEDLAFESGETDEHHAD